MMLLFYNNTGIQGISQFHQLMATELQVFVLVRVTVNAPLVRASLVRITRTLIRILVLVSMLLLLLLLWLLL